MFQLSRLQVQIEFLDDRAPQGFLGSRLRGAFGHALLAQLCTDADSGKRSQCGPLVPHPEDCACDFLRLFKPTRNTIEREVSGAPLGSKENLPATFVIAAPPPRTTAPSSRSLPPLLCSFDFVSIGPMCRYTSTVLKAFEAAGEAGFIVSAQSRARYRITAVRDLLGAGRELARSTNVAIVRDVSEVVHELAPASPPSAITIEFRTPVRIENKNARLKDSKTGLTLFGDFYDLIYNLSGRLAGLWQLYGDGWPGQADFYRWRERLLKQSRMIETLQSDLRLVELKGYSNIQETTKPLDGFVGSMRFAGDFSPFIELLLMGELVHIGGETTCGLGQYRMGTKY